MTREEVIALIDSAKSEKDIQKLLGYFTDLNNINPQKHTIVFYVSGKTGTSWTRIESPMYAIFKKTNDFNLVYTERLTPVYLNIADLLVIHRASDEGDQAHSILKLWPSNKVRPFVIHNVDDNESILPKTHPLYAVWKLHKRDQQSIRSLRESDAVEITTQKLKQYCLNHNKNTFITRNYFNWKLPQWNLPKKRPLQEFILDATPEQIQHFSFPENWKDKIVLGWCGLTSHFNDLEKMAPILKKIHDKHENVVFVIAGMALKDSMITIDQATGKTKETDVPEEQKYRARVRELFIGFDPERLRVWDALQLSEYGWFYSVLDLGICFVEHNTFNAAKSEIKAVEYMKYGAIPVFSNFAGYADLLNILEVEGKFPKELLGRLSCKTEYDTQEWVAAISYWVDMFYSPYREESAHALQEFCEGYYDIDKHISEKISRYKGFIENNIEKEEIQIQQLLMEASN